jgi:hypothetical protein
LRGAVIRDRLKPAVDVDDERGVGEREVVELAVARSDGDDGGQWAAGCGDRVGERVIERAIGRSGEESCELGPEMRNEPDVVDAARTDETIRAAREACVPPSYPRAPQNEKEADAG